ncbi:MAG: antibiotic biosynthesis monooxygenase [Terriglobales bacterium]
MKKTGGGQMSPSFSKRTFMFARIVDFVSRPGKTRTLNETIQSRLFPILRVQPGFVDEIVLESDVEPNRVVTVSFWNTREQAERYNEETYPAVRAVLVGSLEADPVVRTFNVMNSTIPKVAAGRTA